MRRRSSKSKLTSTGLSKSACLLASASSVALLGSLANAAVYQWDPNSADAISRSDGAGTWQAGVGNWTIVSPASTNQNWANAGHSAQFGANGVAGATGTGGIVTLGGDISTVGLTFSQPATGSTGYTIELGSNVLTNAGNLTTGASAGTTTIRSTSGSGSLALGGAQRTWGLTSAVAVSAQITGAGGINKTGASTLSLTNNNNSFAGNFLTQNGGASSVTSIRNSGVNSAVGAGSTVSINDNGNLTYTGSGDTSNRTLNLAGGGNSTLNNNGTGALVLNGAVTNTGNSARLFTIGGNSTTGVNVIEGAIGNSGANALTLTKSGNSTWRLTGTNTYTGITTISAGSLQLGDGTAGKDGTLASASVVNNANLTFNRFGSVSYDGVISGSGTVTKTGAGTQTLTGTNTYGGVTTISQGSLQLGDGTSGNDGTIASTSIVNNGNLIFNRFDTASNSAVISGNGTVVKTGVGTQTLLGTSTFSGGTTVSDGTLRIGSATALSGANGLVNVNGGTLDSSVSAASLGGALTLTSGTVDMNGTSVGSFTLGSTSAFTMVDGIVKFTLGSTFDKLIGGGAGAIFNIAGGTFDLDFTGAGVDYANSFAVLENFGGSNTVSGLSFTGFDTVGYTASLSDTGVLSFTAVPEPSAMALLSLGLVGLVIRRRR